MKEEEKDVVWIMEAVYRCKNCGRFYDGTNGKYNEAYGCQHNANEVKK